MRLQLLNVNIDAVSPQTWFAKSLIVIVFLFVFIPKRVIGLSEGYFDGNDNRDKDGTALGLILGRIVR